MHLGIKNFVGSVKKHQFGDGSYSGNIIQGGCALTPQASYQPPDIMPTATANTTGTWVFSASTEYGGTPAYAAANDTAPGNSGVNYTTWNSTGVGQVPQWWQAAKNDGRAETIDKYTLAAAIGSPLRTPTAFQLWGSNTGAFAGEHTVLDTQSGLAWSAGQVRTFPLAAPATFTHYRIAMTAYGSGGDGYYNIGEVELLPPAMQNCIVITAAATVAPDATTGAAAFTAQNVCINGGSLAPSTNCKGLIGIVSGSVRLVNGGRAHIDKLGKAGNFGNLTVLDLVPAGVRRKLKSSLASWVVLGEGAAGAAGSGGYADGKAGSAAGSLQTGGGGSGGLNGYNPSSSGAGGKGGPCCGGSGSPGIVSNNTTPYTAPAANPHGGPGLAATSDTATCAAGGGTGDTPGTGANGGLTPAGAGGGLLMLFTPLLSVASGCVISADGAAGVTGSNTYQTGSGGAGGGCVVIGTLTGGCVNSGTVRASGGAGTTGATHKNGGPGGAGSVNTFTLS